MDDGFQHLQLARDLDLVVLDGRQPFGNGYGLPAGELREPPQALGRADLIILTKIFNQRQKQTALAMVRRYNAKASVVVACHTPKDLVSIRDNKRLSLKELQGKSILAFCGIGDPEYFFHTLKNLGARIKEYIIFSDHHWYLPEEIKQIEQRALSARVWGMVTTEKDAIRLVDLPQGEIFSLRIEMQIIDGVKLWETKLA